MDGLMVYLALYKIYYLFVQKVLCFSNILMHLFLKNLQYEYWARHVLQAVSGIGVYLSVYTLIRGIVWSKKGWMTWYFFSTTLGWGTTNCWKKPLNQATLSWLTLIQHQNGLWRVKYRHLKTKTFLGWTWTHLHWLQRRYIGSTSGSFRAKGIKS